MRGTLGTAISAAAALAFIGVLLWPYAVRPVAAIEIYYGSGVFDPLLVGVLVIGAVATLVAIRRGTASSIFGIGVALSLSAFAFLVALLWAGTARVDVFRAPGWAFPAQRWVLVALAGLVVFGVAWTGRSRGVLVRNR